MALLVIWVNLILSLLLKGLQRLEYRGYDSAGLALIDGDNLSCIKQSGKVSELNSKIEKISIHK